MCLTDSYRLHLHTEDPGEDNSACGLILCATLTKNARIIDQCISRFGGLLLLNNETLCGNSTAHGILDMLTLSGIYSTDDENSETSDTSDPESEIEAEGQSTVRRYWKRTDDESNRSASNPDTNNTEPTIISITSGIKKWRVIPEIIILDFVRMVLPDPNRIWRLSAKVNAHDFALFRSRCDAFESLKNSYEHKSVKHLVTTEGFANNIGKSHSPIPIYSDMVTVLLGRNTFVHGRFLPGISTIHMSGVQFSTIRISLEDCLGKYSATNCACINYTHIFKH